MNLYFNGKSIFFDRSWRPNILDNWYFANPINQYRANSYTPQTRSKGYTIDRWKLTSGTLTVESNGCRLNGTLTQILENSILSGTVTATALAEDGPVAASYNNTTKTFTITASGKKLIAAKLEIGAAQTLYHIENGEYVLNDPPPNMYDMLARCQRYQIELVNELSSYSEVGFGFAYGSSESNRKTSYVIVPIPVTMRALPTIKTKGIFIFSPSQAFSGPNLTGVGSSAMYSSKNIVEALCYFDEPLQSNIPYGLLTNSQSSSFFLDANL